MTDSHSPAFLLGLPRSGTTVVSYLLGSHPDIAVPPEPWLLLAVEAIGEVSPINPADSVYLAQAFREFTAGCDLVAAKRAFASRIYEDHLRQQGKRLLLDKSPRYWLVLDSIHAMYPEARHLWLRRNPFAVLASMKSTWQFDLLARLDEGGDSLHVFDLVIGSRSLVDFAARHPEQVLPLRYETFMADPVGEARRAFAFLGARPFDVATDIDAGASRHAGASLGDPKFRETRAVRPEDPNAWKSVLSDAEIGALYGLLGHDLVTELGYPEVAAEARRLTGAGDSEAAAELRARVEDAFRARRLDIERLCNPQEFDENVFDAVRVAYRNPKEVFDALAWYYREREPLIAAFRDLDESLKKVTAERDRALAELRQRSITGR
jgi:hypothetical protein